MLVVSQTKLKISLAILTITILLALIDTRLNIGLVMLLGIIIFIASYACLYFQKKIINEENQKILQTKQSLNKNVPGSDNLTQLFDLTHRIIKVWSGQISLAQDQGNENIDQLAGNYTQINDKLVKAIKTFQETTKEINSDNGITHTIEKSELALHKIINVLKDAMIGRAHISNELNNLSATIQKLSQIGDEVTTIASQENSLALNTSNDATKNGEKATRLADVIEKVNVTLQNTLTATQKCTEQDALIINSVEQTLQRIINDYSSAGENIILSANQLEQESTEVKRAMDVTLISLQFQDRVSQILSHVLADMNKLASHYQQYQLSISQGNTIKPIDIEQWLNNIKETYTTSEQVAVHDGNEIPNNQKNNEVTFF
jgi:methyl-accepting chemotaxis protein